MKEFFEYIEIAAGHFKDDIGITTAQCRKMYRTPLILLGDVGGDIALSLNHAFGAKRKIPGVWGRSPQGIYAQ